MAAGIISANLPTMLPVLALVVRKLGLSKVVSVVKGTSAGQTGERTGRSGTTSKNKTTQSRGDIDTKGLVPERVSRSLNSSATFYRLSDDTDSEGNIDNKVQDDRTNTADQTEPKLRPDAGADAYEFAVNSPKRPGTAGSTRDLGMDDIPMHGIRVHKEFKREFTGV